MNQSSIEAYLADAFHISKPVIDLVEATEKAIKPQLDARDTLAEYHQYRVIQAMQAVRLSDRHFHPSTGYGYDDEGRDAIEKIYADVFGCEAALVRPHISSGTHAISLALYGVLRPGDELLSISGDPYDTVRSFIGAHGEEKGTGTLADFGVTFKQVELTTDGTFDKDAIMAALSSKTKMVYIQRSTGYSWRKAITLDMIADICKTIKDKWPNVVIFVDNCYGEFLDEKEPVAVGADLMAGSLIKNPGGGIAPTGGYVAGRQDLVELAADRLAAPGVGGETGATLGISKTFMQGFFQAPMVVSQAMKTAMLVGAVYKELGFDVCPDVDDYRSDIIQSVKLGDPESVKIFCRAVQEAAPVDSFVTPEPWDMPGYDVPVIMAAGAFIQGSSIELSADAPMREPYIVYFQGGLTHAHGKLGLMLTVQRLLDAEKITLPKQQKGKQFIKELTGTLKNKIENIDLGLKPESEYTDEEKAHTKRLSAKLKAEYLAKQREITEEGRPNKPEGKAGAQMLSRMNDSHAPMTKWALSHLDFKPDDDVLDVGCGGGACLARISPQITSGHLTGVDYSAVSVAQAKQYNKADVDAGKMTIVEGSVSDLPFDDDTFDKIVTVESYYFWPDLDNDMKEVIRVLKPGGKFLLVAEIYDHPGLSDKVLDNIKKYDMRNLSKDEFETLFAQTGFADTQIHIHPEEGWICVEGTK